MWGQIILDISYHTNYWFGFPESNSDILLNLTHWQYWWWFWFTYLICLYYLFFLKIVRNRLLKFNPKIVTSYRAHGKWGDFIICLLPISWCINILSNSNFILRMLEWQTESNLFTIRIRGKQWYWIYKIEVKSLLNINQVPKNLGHNHWILFNNTNLNFSEEYINLIQLKFNNTWLNNYIENVLNVSNDFNSKLNNSLNNTIKNDFEQSSNLINPINSFNLFNNLNEINYFNSFTNMKINEDNLLFKNFFNKKITFIAEIFNKNIFELKNKNLINFSSNYIDDTYRYLRTNFFAKKKLIKFNYLNDSINININNTNINAVNKNQPDNLYLVIKQKRYTALQKLKLFSNQKGQYSFELLNSSVLKLNQLLKIENKNNLLTNNNNTKLDNINMFSKQNLKLIYRTRRKKSNLFVSLNNRRLLRTKRILVVPSNINITLITNSFDVVHSWYVPGLGVKMDCIPGRSTHHSLHIDHAGFYYGQCAEICGRHHHHMPIRICALPFEHFLIWWYHYGLPYFNSINLERKISTKTGIKQFNW